MTVVKWSDPRRSAPCPTANSFNEFACREADPVVSRDDDGGSIAGSGRNANRRTRRDIFDRRTDRSLVNLPFPFEPHRDVRARIGQLLVFVRWPEQRRVGEASVEFENPRISRRLVVPTSHDANSHPPHKHREETYAEA